MKKMIFLAPLALLVGCNSTPEKWSEMDEIFESSAPRPKGKSPRISVRVVYQFVNIEEKRFLSSNLQDLLSNYTHEKLNSLGLHEVQTSSNPYGQNALMCTIMYKYNDQAQVETTATCVKNDNNGTLPLKPQRYFDFTGDVFAAIKEIAPSEPSN